MNIEHHSYSLVMLHQKFSPKSVTYKYEVLCLLNIRSILLLFFIVHQGYGCEVDCWATGIILYILLCGYPPFKTADRNQEELFQMIQRGKFIFDPEYWSSISTSTNANSIDYLSNKFVLVECYYSRRQRSN
jgi:serine/threonine protein kinase